MATFVLIHAAGDSGWSWHLVEAALRANGHDVVAPDLPGDEEGADLVAEALERERAHPSTRATREPWPLAASGGLADRLVHHLASTHP